MLNGLKSYFISTPLLLCLSLSLFYRSINTKCVFVCDLLKFTLNQCNEIKGNLLIGLLINGGALMCHDQ